uniref:Uncharacterized protein n=1 Tax=Branchiostoma floridae TaxID=7739 RepID=C3YDI8_BRAFL|eukprot:XP_002605789.1 hypothetical protein BRAFLDRAFT_78060 [Branchiostoma floridae]
MERNSLLRDLSKRPFLFRCNTPPELVDVELFRLDISMCPDPKQGSQLDTCALDSCPAGGHPDVITSSLLPPTTSKFEEEEPKQTETFTNTNDVSDVMNATLVAARTSGQMKASSEMLAPLEKSTHWVFLTKMPQTPPRNPTKPPSQPDSPVSGWLLTVLVVALILVICGVAMVVFCLIARTTNQPGKTVQLDTALRTPFSDLKRNAVPKSDPDTSVYESIPHEVEGPYAESFSFEVPQYELTKISHG